MNHYAFKDKLAQLAAMSLKNPERINLLDELQRAASSVFKKLERLQKNTICEKPGCKNKPYDDYPFCIMHIKIDGVQ